MARDRAAAVSFGSKLFIFGGADRSGTALGDAAIYDASTNAWSLASSDANAPTARMYATAVWTGTQIIVYGGRASTSGAALATGAIYTPSLDSWMPLVSGITPRSGAVGVASNSYAVFWGVYNSAGSFTGSTERLDLNTNTWASPPTYGMGTSSPGALQDAATAFSGTELYLFGGLTSSSVSSNAFWQYRLGSNAWTQLMAMGGPDARYGAFSVWDGRSVYVWGGRDDVSAASDGAYYAANLWTTMPGFGGLTARWAQYRQSGWAFALGTNNIVILGGLDFAGALLTNGAQYVLGSGWTKIPSWPSGEAHQAGVAANVGGAIVLWGGRNGNTVSDTGERWVP